MTTQTLEDPASVLIVEDEGIIAHDVASMLETLGYSVCGITSSGAGALAFAERQRVNLVLMDIRLKGDMDGIQTASKLKERHRLPVVYMTAHTDDQTLARARETEPFGFIAKPLTTASIKVAMSIALQRHRLQCQAQEREDDLRSAVEALADAQRELTQSNKNLTYLTQALSHDLKEPLHTISVCTSVLSVESETALTEENREYLHAITEGCRRMETLIAALIDYFSAASIDKRGALPICAGAPLNEALLNLASAINVSHAQIDTADLPSVVVHPTALLLIFQNLIGNAIKYAGGKPPHIWISAQPDGDFWRFTVKDNGIGFESGQSERIFELFKRAHGREYPGTGLGLAMCQRLVEQHHGRIWAESEPGKGSQFHFTIPA